MRMRPSAATMKVSHPRRQNGMCQRPKVSPSARRRRHGALHALLPFFSTERNSEDVGDHGCSCDGAGDAPWNSFPPGTPCFLNGAITPPRTFAQHTIFAANLTFPDKLGAAGPSNSVPRRENPHRPHADLRWRGGRALVCATVPPSRIAIQNGLMLLRGAAVGPQATRGPGYQTSRKEHTPFDHRVPLSPCSVRLRLGPVAACKPLRQPTPRTLTQKRWKFVTQQSSLYKKLGGFFNRLSQSLLML